jgi:hypothetical protein
MSEAIGLVWDSRIGGPGILCLNSTVGFEGSGRIPEHEPEVNTTRIPIPLSYISLLHVTPGCGLVLTVQCLPMPEVLFGALVLGQRSNFVIG